MFAVIIYKNENETEMVATIETRAMEKCVLTNCSILQKQKLNKKMIQVLMIIGLGMLLTTNGSKELAGFF